MTKNTSRTTRCPICNPALDRTHTDAAKTTRTGHHNTAAHSHGSHKACYAINAHPATPAGRAACRRVTSK